MSFKHKDETKCVPNVHTFECPSYMKTFKQATDLEGHMPQVYLLCLKKTAEKAGYLRRAINLKRLLQINKAVKNEDEAISRSRPKHKIVFVVSPLLPYHHKHHIIW